MANRQNTLLIKRSNVIGKLPPISGLTLGELALNTADAKLYTLFTSGTTGATEVRQIGWDRVSKTGDTITGDLIVDGNLTATTISATTYYNLPVSGLTEGSNISITDSNGNYTISVTGITGGGGGDYLPLSGGTVTGTTYFTQGVSGNTVSATTFNFDTTNTGTPSYGQMNWNLDFGVPQVGMIGGNVVQKVGESVYAYVKNVDTTTLNKGEVVYLYGASGDKISVQRASNTGDTTSSKTLGVVAESIAVNGLGYVITQGTLDGLNLGSYTAGDVVWLSDVAGQFTKTKQYAPYHLVFIGVIQRANNGNGQLYVKPQNGYELDELHNVAATGATMGDLLSYSPSNGTRLWVNTKTLNGSYTITGNTSIGGNLTVTGNTSLQGLTASTISATTYQNLPSGVWGISNSGGTYTYYSTLSTAMSAATSGQTIEMFTDVTETGNVSIGLKQGVNINGNGHTYTYNNNSGTTFTYILPGGNTTTVIDILNLYIVRNNTTSTGSPIFGSFTNPSGTASTTINFINTTITYTATSGDTPIVDTTAVLHPVTINGLTCTSNGSGTAIRCTSANFCTITCTGTSNGYGGGTINNSRIRTTSGNGVEAASATFCNITCTTSGIGVREGSASDTSITTNTGNCMQSGSAIAQGSANRCVATSTSGQCYRRVITTNCVGSTGANTAVDHWFNYNDGTAKFYRNYFSTNSTVPVVINGTAGTFELVDTTIIQNGTGSGVRLIGAVNQDIINCTFIMASSASNCITATSSTNARFINNKFKGATTPINANVIQQVVNTFDNQGNILL